MDPKHSSEMFKHLEKQQEILIEAYRSLSLELHNLQVEEEMLMRKFYEFMSARGLDKKVMDTSSPAVFVNSELLKMYLGRRVRTVIQVGRFEGGTMIGQSIDGHQLIVKGSQAFPLSHFVEVIGIADGNQSIRAEICTDFGENFDTMAYNQLCQLANGEHKNLFL